jgi:hypothetical protein
VTGLMINLLGDLICWRPKGQRGVTPSSRFAEYVAISVTVKENSFIYFLLKGWELISIPGIILSLNMLKTD